MTRVCATMAESFCVLGVSAAFVMALLPWVDRLGYHSSVAECC